MHHHKEYDTSIQKALLDVSEVMLPTRSYLATEVVQKLGVCNDRNNHYVDNIEQCFMCYVDVPSLIR